ncbi:winged helix-turn-helix domain-containing protein [Streptomyces netropsis]|uniref:winged helix-turn-helix domain-containing protein n=1 Tax=Streptomyces netropsis TaxID=55404 RepID=UPI0037A6A74D
MWTAARVARLIGRKFHVSYSVSGATRLMRRLGFRSCPASSADRHVVWCQLPLPGSRGLGSHDKPDLERPGG